MSATYIVYECGRPSDCTNGDVCCFTNDGVCGVDDYMTSKCVPPQNCLVCGHDDGGVGMLGCDVASGTDCPNNAPCTQAIAGTIYTGCAP